MLEEVLSLIETLPLDSMEDLIKAIEERKNISKKVAKLLQLFESLSNEEKHQFFINVKSSIYGSKQSGTSEEIVGLEVSSK